MSDYLFIATNGSTLTDVERAFSKQVFVADANESKLGNVVRDGCPDWTVFHLAVGSSASTLLGKAGRIERGKILRTPEYDDRELLWSGCKALLRGVPRGSLRLLAHRMRGYWNLEPTKLRGKETLYLDEIDVEATEIDLDVLYSIRPTDDRASCKVFL